MASRRAMAMSASSSQPRFLAAMVGRRSRMQPAGDAASSSPEPLVMLAGVKDLDTSAGFSTAELAPKKKKKLIGGGAMDRIASKAAEQKSSGENPEQDGAHLPKDDPLQALVVLQTFSGYWTWSDELLDLLKVDGNATTTKLQGFAGEIGQNEMATALVISYLQKKLSSERDTWELLVDKATSWLGSEIGDSAKALIEAAGELFE